VEITEYADYQCPFCQTFATLQMPTIEQRLIETGRLRWRYRDFPLQQHQYSRLAAHSAACADEQGKYWSQHQKIYEGQSEWAESSNAAAIFRRYAGEIGLKLDQYDACMKSGKYAGRIQASYEEGVQAGVSSTPTLLVGGRLYQGRFDSDAITRLVDSLAPRTASAR
jgi:protein-disulfide isomerase